MTLPLSSSATPSPALVMDADINSKLDRLRSILQFSLIHQLPSPLLCYCFGFLDSGDFIVLPCINKYIASLIPRIGRHINLTRDCDAYDSSLMDVLANEPRLIKLVRTLRLTDTQLHRAVVPFEYTKALKVMTQLECIKIEWIPSSSSYTELDNLLVLLYPFIPSCRSIDIFGITRRVASFDSLGPRRNGQLMTSLPCPPRFNGLLLAASSERPTVTWCGNIPSLCANVKCRTLCYPIICQPKPPLVCFIDSQHQQMATTNDGDAGQQPGLDGAPAGTTPMTGLCRSCSREQSTYQTCSHCHRLYHNNDHCSPLTWMNRCRIRGCTISQRCGYCKVERCKSCHLTVSCSRHPFLRCNTCHRNVCIDYPSLPTTASSSRSHPSTTIEPSCAVLGCNCPEHRNKPGLVWCPNHACSSRDDYEHKNGKEVDTKSHHGESKMVAIYSLFREEAKRTGKGVRCLSSSPFFLCLFALLYNEYEWWLWSIVCIH
jgi:hypothetical protein